MRSLTSTGLLFLILLSQNCASIESENGNHCWLSVQYTECLKNNLPCYCEKNIGSYFSLVLDSNPNSKNFGVSLLNFEQMEPYFYPIRKTGRNEYAILKSEEDSTTWAKISYTADELRLRVESSSEFLFSKSRVESEYDVDHYYEDNVALLNAAFESRGYPKLEKIVEMNGLKCDCNKWIGKMDLLSVEGSSKSWILEMKNDSLRILKIKNYDKDLDDPIETELFRVYRWK